MKILITGGAGYVGTTLIALLLENGHETVCYDNLLYEGDPILTFFRNPRFTFVYGDVRDGEKLKKNIQDVDFIVHLAAVVGYPACKKNPQFAQDVNVNGTKILNLVRSVQQPIIFASTGSTYGALEDGMCTESTPMNPLTVYGRNKAEAEKILLDSGNAVIYRFATAFGLSQRMRLDLLINDFCYQAIRNRSLVIYEPHFKRTFVHVYDMARAFLHAIENYGIMKDQVFNVGDESMNGSKMDIAKMILARTEYYFHVADVGKDEDARNYVVSYEKLKATGFRTKITLDDGIAELLRALQVLHVRNPYSNV